jgi:hypothetical protein
MAMCVIHTITIFEFFFLLQVIIDRLVVTIVLFGGFLRFLIFFLFLLLLLLVFPIIDQHFILPLIKFTE